MLKVTGHFELINYSEWGTRVNGVVYAADVSQTRGQEEDDRAEALRDIVRSRGVKLPRYIHYMIILTIKHMIVITPNVKRLNTDKCMTG